MYSGSSASSCSGALGRGRCDQVVIPVVATGIHRHLVVAPPHNHDVFDRRATIGSNIGGPLERNHRSPTPRTVLGDDHLGRGILNPVGQRLAREATEHH